MQDHSRQEVEGGVHKYKNIIKVEIKKVKDKKKKDVT